jgi:DNA-binding beta-propeller fold protein YncE
MVERPGSGMRLALLFVVTTTAATAMATDLIVSTNDAKYVRVAGRDTFPPNPGPDTLNVIDASVSPPRVVATVEIATSIAGPPQAVAITPDGNLAVVSATNRYNYDKKEILLDTFLQVVDLEANPLQVTDQVDVRHHPQGLAINREGNLLLAATVGGTVAVLKIEGKQLKLIDEVKIGDRRLAGVSFTHDGKAALAALRDEQGIVVLDVAGDKVSTTRECVSTGVAPYAIDISSDGCWAVVCNAGLAGLANPGKICGDADTCTLIDVSKRPFRAIQHVTVPSIPEGVAISPDGKWIAVQAMDGSNLPPDNPGYHARGRLLLFEIRNGQAVPVADLPTGVAAQGIVFSADSRYVLAQFNVEKEIAVFAVNDGKMTDTGHRIQVPGGPVSIRSMPR